MSLIDPVRMIRPKRKIRGYSAILLPFESSGQVDWKGFEDHVARTHHAGLIPAVNMDTGFGNLIDPPLKDEVLKRTRSVVGKGEFVAGAFVGDTQGASLNLQAYKAAMDQIHQYQGIPVIFQSYGLTGQSAKA
ncbi:MAG: dihydrodipicolinate synthase family protein, partial [Gemmataceae bacterium]